MNETLLTALTPALIIDALQQAGCRAAEVRHQQDEVIESALQGLGFTVAFGNRLPDEGGERYVDCAFRCVLRIQGDFPEEKVALWNRDRRFARLARHGDALVLSLDVLPAGGVSSAWLRAQVELWDLLLREYLRFLQAPAAEAA